MKLPLLLLACAFALLAAQPACGSPSLSEVEESLALLEAFGESSPSSSSVSEAEAYAADKLKHAQAESTALLDAAAKDGKKMAEQLEAKAAQREQPDGAPKQRPDAAAAAQPDAPAKESSASKPKLSATALRTLRKARGLRNKQGVYGAVDLGASLSDSAPSSKSAVLTPAGSAVRQVKRGEKDIYGSPASCLKDIAAHFDEKDIYESKKNTLKRKLEEASDRTVASKLRNQLANLEMWHQSMQKKFLMSALEAKQHRAKMMRLLDENLPKELKDQLKANQIAKRAAQKIPFPDAQRKVAKFMRANRKRIQQRERLRELGHKVMVRPIIDNPAFPSMDPITSHLREKQWRRVMLDDKWSTDAGDLEAGQNLVKAAFQQHGDFVNGPIAEPMLKGKLYNAKTEPLGVPNFLLKFPWPMDPNGPVSMDEKVKVEQTDYTTW